MGRRRRKSLGRALGDRTRKAISGNQVYVLQLRDNCFYVGYTHDISQRIKKHKRKKGASWTTLHRPMKVIWHQRFSSKDEAYKMEHILTRYYALNYGQDNVRGSVWSTLRVRPPAFLNENEKNILLNLGFHVNTQQNPSVNYYPQSPQPIQQFNQPVINTSVKYCSNCGKQLQKISRFCNECGFRL